MIRRALLAGPLLLSLSGRATAQAPGTEQAPPPIPPPPHAPGSSEPAGMGYVAAPQGAIPPQSGGYYYATDVPLRPFRPFTVSASVGPAGLFGPSDSGLPAVRDLAFAFALRLGVGLTHRLSLSFAYEGAGTRTTAVNGDDSWLRQTNWLVGLQGFFGQRFYARGSIGAGYLTERARTFSVGSNTGFAAAAALGWELAQGDHLALAVELRTSITVVPRETWEMLGANLAFSFF